MSKIDRKLYDAVKKNKVCKVTTNDLRLSITRLLLFVRVLVWVLKCHMCLPNECGVTAPLLRAHSFADACGSVFGTFEYVW